MCSTSRSSVPCVRGVQDDAANPGFPALTRRAAIQPRRLRRVGGPDSALSARVRVRACPRSPPWSCGGRSGPQRGLNYEADPSAWRAGRSVRCFCALRRSRWQHSPHLSGGLRSEARATRDAMAGALAVWLPRAGGEAQDASLGEGVPLRPVTGRALSTGMCSDHRACFWPSGQ